MFNETANETLNRIEAWLPNGNVGNKITNLRLHYFNRANKWLQMYRPWEGMNADTSLTVSNSQATLPTDLIRIIAVGYDFEGDKRAEYHYFKDAEQGEGYYIQEAFTKAAGRTLTMHLFIGFPYNPNLLRYQKQLENYTDSEAGGGDAEYLFFPSELMFSTAKRIRLQEKKPDSNEYNAVLAEQKELLKMYTGAVQYQNETFKRQINGANGQPINIDSVTLNGQTRPQRVFFRNDQDINT